ncbi:MAG: peptidase, partial [Treponema sp.]|nr:peptidase [Treponema sp.]
ATDQGLAMIKQAATDEAVIRLRSLEEFEKSADGKATKIIIPADIQNMAGIFSAASEVLKK